jgi:hypothetical protein
MVALAVGVSLALPGNHSSGAARVTPPRGPRVNSSAPASQPPLAGPGGARTLRPPTPSAPAPAAALAVARSWVTAFLTVPKGITADRWVEQLRPYTTDDLFPELRSIDPANVPAAQIIDAPRTVSVSAGTAEVDVPTTGVVVRLLLVSTPAGWRVASYERVG